jgi:hypothetical protein
MIELLERLKFVAIVLMMFNIHPDVLMHAQSGDNGLPPFTKGWTDSEKMRFKECVSHISDPSRESTLQLSTDSYACLILEEEQHWMNLHPQARGKKENLAKKRNCFDKHPLQIRGTAEDFHSSFDLCMCAAYGLPKPKL